MEQDLLLQRCELWYGSVVQPEKCSSTYIWLFNRDAVVVVAADVVVVVVVVVLVVVVAAAAVVLAVAAVVVVAAVVPVIADIQSASPVTE